MINDKYIHYRAENFVKMGANELQSGIQWARQGDLNNFDKNFQNAIKVYNSHLRTQLKTIKNSSLNIKVKKVNKILEDIDKQLLNIKQCKKMSDTHLVELIIENAQLGKNIDKVTLLNNIIINRDNQSLQMSFSIDKNKEEQLNIHMDTLIEKINKSKNIFEINKHLDEEKNFLNDFNFILQQIPEASHTEKNIKIISSTQQKINQIREERDLLKAKKFPLEKYKTKILEVLHNAKQYGGIKSIISKLNGSLAEVVSAIALNSLPNFVSKQVNDIIVGTERISYQTTTHNTLISYREDLSRELMKQQAGNLDNTYAQKRINKLNSLLKDVDFLIGSKVQGKNDLTVTVQAKFRMPKRIEGFSVKNYNLSEKNSPIHIGEVNFGDLLLYLDEIYNNSQIGSLGSYFLNFFVRFTNKGNVTKNKQEMRKVYNFQWYRDKILQTMSLQAALNASTGLMGARAIGGNFPQTFIISDTKDNKLNFYSIKDLLMMYDNEHNKIFNFEVSNLKLPFNFNVNLNNIIYKNFLNTFAPTKEARVAAVMTQAHKAKIKVTLAQKIDKV